MSALNPTKPDFAIRFAAYQNDYIRFGAMKDGLDQMMVDEMHRIETEK